MKKIYLFLAMVFIKADFLLAMAPPQSKNGQPQQGGGFGSLMVLLLPLMLVWYFFLIRPQQKKEKEKKRMLEEMKKGDNIMTIGGIFGEVVQVKDNRITIKIADKTNIEVSKTAISGKVNQ